MTLYSIVLFLHLASVLGPFATLSFEVLSLFRLRQALDLPEVRRWIDPVPGLPLVAMASILIVFFSGIFLTVRLSAFDTAWPKVTIGALLLIAPLGALTGKRMRVIRLNSAEASAMRPEVLRRLTVAVHTNGLGFSFQAARNAFMAAISTCPTRKGKRFSGCSTGPKNTLNLWTPRGAASLFPPN